MQRSSPRKAKIFVLLRQKPNTLFKITRETFYIHWLLDACRDYNHAHLKSKAAEDGDAKEDFDWKLLDHLAEKISQIGYHNRYNENPNVYYGVARYRKTSRQPDRIYAIMQTYDLRVGKSIRPWDNPTLDQLKDEFAQAINKRCPILGQLFIHTAEP